MNIEAHTRKVNLIFVHRKRKGVGKRDEEKERKKKTAKRVKKTAKEPLADIPEEKEDFVDVVVLQQAQWINYQTIK